MPTRTSKQMPSCPAASTSSDILHQPRGHCAACQQPRDDCLVVERPSGPALQVCFGCVRRLDAAMTQHHVDTIRDWATKAGIVDDKQTPSCPVRDAAPDDVNLQTTKDE